jgi:hypothetical protein
MNTTRFALVRAPSVCTLGRHNNPEPTPAPQQPILTVPNFATPSWESRGRISPRNRDRLRVADRTALKKLYEGSCNARKLPGVRFWAGGFVGNLEGEGRIEGGVRNKFTVDVWEGWR